MRFRHLVKHNGVYYPAGTDVPVGDFPVKEEIPVAEETDVAKASKYTIEELNALGYMKLKSLAKENGISVPNTIKSDELKKLLLEVQ